MAGDEQIPSLTTATLSILLRKLSSRARTLNTRYGRNPEKLISELDEMGGVLDRIASTLEGEAADRLP
jgi:hypothetical protein